MLPLYHYGGCHIRMCPQGGLDLGGFDAVAVVLDLLVEATEVLDAAVGKETGEIARAIEASRSGTNLSGTKR